MSKGTAIPPAMVGTLRGVIAAALAALVSALADTQLDWGQWAPIIPVIAGLVPMLYGVADQLGGQPGQTSLVAGKDVTVAPEPERPSWPAKATPLVTVNEGPPMTPVPAFDPEALADAMARAFYKLASMPPPESQA